ncbi:LysR family transcriptional regulator [Ochrobactrum sp. BTU1]|uniref:LysR family transcriptional regulator n=1 Tax=Ochrobactrum sp. BTU1 TaxID=2840456 RepID=UPI001C046EC6|nr:LysR family transcriptional regulator [Ochrobactrum sp. BTU1]
MSFDCSTEENNSSVKNNDLLRNDNNRGGASELSGIDLNLLVALEALLVCRNVTHAAHRLGQTQPAVSRALARLRDVLGDDILVRSSTGMKLTARGEYLQQTVPAAMRHIRDVITSRTGEAEMRVSVSSELMPIVLPYLFNSTAKDNETVTLGSHKSENEAYAQLRMRTADLTLGIFHDDMVEGIESEFFFKESFVTLVSSEITQRPATNEEFLGARHVVVVENGNHMFPQVHESLQRNGVRKSNILEMPDILAAALLVSERELKLTVPRSIAGWLSRTQNFVAFVPPVEITPHKISIAWATVSNASLRLRMISNIQQIVLQALRADQLLVKML